MIASEKEGSVSIKLFVHNVEQRVNGMGHLIEGGEFKSQGSGCGFGCKTNGQFSTVWSRSKSGLGGRVQKEILVKISSTQSCHTVIKCQKELGR